MDFNCQYHMFPEQVFKGRKMPGRMGGKQRTVKNVWVYKIDPARNLMWVKGQVCFSCKINFSVFKASNLNRYGGGLSCPFEMLARRCANEL